MIDPLDRGIVDDGAEANKIIARFNNQLWGTAETEGDGCGVVLLEVADGLPLTISSHTQKLHVIVCQSLVNILAI